jgi:Aminotransferase class-III/Pyridoxal-dependent decarboxylase conserved domain
MFAYAPNSDQSQPSQYYLKRQAKTESNARSYPRRLPLAIASAQGIFVKDVDGATYMDCLCGAGTLALGHNHPVVIEAIRKHLDAGYPLHTLDLTTPVKDEFVHALFDTLPPELGREGRIQFCSPSGADAVEPVAYILLGGGSFQRRETRDPTWSGVAIGGAGAGGFAIPHETRRLNVTNRLRSSGWTRLEALKLWTSFQARGQEQFAAMIGRLAELAQFAARPISALPDFETLHEPEFGCVAFRYTGPDADVVNRAIAKGLFDSGRAVLGHTAAHGRPCLKLTFNNPCTTEEQVSGLLNLVAASAVRPVLMAHG